MALLELLAEGDRRREVPAWLRKVVLRGLRADPRERYSSMAALLDALRGPAARQRGWTRWAMAAALVLGGAGLGLVSTSGQPGVGQSAAATWGASPLSSASASASVAALEASASPCSLASSSSSPSRRR